MYFGMLSNKIKFNLKVELFIFFLFLKMKSVDMTPFEAYFNCKVLLKLLPK